MTQSIEGTSYVRPLSQCVHLVHSDAGQPSRVGLDGIEDTDGFSVRDGDDHVVVIVEQIDRRRRIPDFLPRQFHVDDSVA